MKYSDNSVNILTTKTFKSIGRAWIVKNLKGNESIEKIVSLLNSKSKINQNVTIETFETKKNEIENLLFKIEKSCDGILAIGDKDFPRYRGNPGQSDQPIYIFYKGNIKLLDKSNKNITVIGLLNPDKSIEKRENIIVEQIVENNVTVVSGLANGCDSIAHKQALINGKTIAILPSPLNNIIPSKNKNLALEIVEKGGLLITEYYEDFKTKMELSSRYKERDRLQALFCDIIVLIASYSQNSAKLWNISDQKLDSGARLAMEYAKKYNIPRAVMYNANVDLKNPMFDLNRQLIKEQSDITILTKNNLLKIINSIDLPKENLSTYQPDLFRNL
jgi:DNA processing protein